MIVYTFSYGQAKELLNFFEHFLYPEEFEVFEEFDQKSEDFPVFYNRSENVNEGTVLFDDIGFQLTKRIKPEGLCQRFLHWLCLCNNKVPLFLSEKQACFLYYYLALIQAFFKKEVLAMECEGKPVHSTLYIAALQDIGWCEDMLQQIRATMNPGPFERGCENDASNV